LSIENLDLHHLSLHLQSLSITSRQPVEECLAAINDDEGEGARAFLLVNSVGALAAADEVDAARRAGRQTPPFAGIPISVKDIFDIEGQSTMAGSAILRGTSKANRDASAVARLKQAGLIILGRTNMTEFAYSCR
jgi:aspartyl-tRNA(Asn)/glutamyl-tRNA(Gln) amidotransferase subunit A